MEKSLSRAGAVGDGKTIDTGAIQDAVAEVEHNTRFEAYGSDTPFSGVGELIWPQALFLVDDTIRITRSLRLRGEGQAEYSSGARIQQQRPGRDLFRVEPIAQGCSVGFSNLVLRANGGGGSGGALLRVTKAAGSCNSIRIVEVVFGTPQTHAIDIECGDDVLIARCLFDVSATQCISMGGITAESKVTNARIVDSYFFSVAQVCIVLANVDGATIQGNNVFTETATRTFVHTPGSHRVRNIIVHSNTVNKVDCFADITNVDGFIVDANVGEAMGAGVAPRRALIRCQEACSGIIVTANRFKGEATMGFYDDEGASVDQAVLSSNSLVATEIKVAALRAANTRGYIGNNAVDGASIHGIGHRWTTKENALMPGKIGSHVAVVLTLPVTGTVRGDGITAQLVRGSLPDGIVMTTRSLFNAITVRYANVSDREINVPAHDLSVIVTR